MSYRHALLTALCASTLHTACSVEVNGGKRGPFDQNVQDATSDDASVSDAGNSAADAAPPPPDALVADATSGEPDTGLEEVDAYVPPPDPRDVVLGHYALRRRFRTVRQVQTRPIPTTLRVLTTTFAVAEIKKTIDDRYVLREQDCRVLLDTEVPNSLTEVTITVADAVPQSVAGPESVLELKFEGDTLRFAKPLSSVPLGWVAGSTSDALPATAMDARVRDGDNDGNPGVTAHVAMRSTFRVEGDTYLVQWNRTFYQGTRASDGRLFGENVDESTQHILGTSRGAELFGAPQQITPDADKSQNVVELVPVTDELDCDALIAQVDALFSD